MPILINLISASKELIFTKSHIDKNAVLLVNAIGIILFIGVASLKFLFNNTIFIIAFIIWTGFIIYANYTVIVKNSDITEDIKAANKHHLFDSEAKALTDAYLSVTARKDFFENMDEDSKFKEVYELIYQQIYGNIKSAVTYMKTYDYVTNTNRHSPLLIKLISDNNNLLKQLSELIELVIKIDSTADDVDLTVVDCMLEALREVYPD